MKTVTFKHGTVSGYKYRGCKCLACCDAYSAYLRNSRRQRAYGRWQPLVDAAPVREHLEGLHARGMTWEQISRVSGIPAVELRRLRIQMGSHQPPERIRRERAQLLMAVEFNVTPTTPKALVPSVGTVRRVQGLRAIGWPLPVLADRSGLSRHALTGAMRRAAVQEATRIAVVELYDDLMDQDPRRHGVPDESARKAITWAARSGWAAPSCWLSSNIDDPDAKPGSPEGRRYSTPSVGDRRQAIIEDTAELARQGCTRQVIAARLGVQWEAVHRAHQRAGVPVPAVLNAGSVAA